MDNQKFLVALVKATAEVNGHTFSEPLAVEKFYGLEAGKASAVDVNTIITILKDVCAVIKNIDTYVCPIINNL